MKYFIPVCMVIVALGIASAASAQTPISTLPDPGTLPDSPLYFLKSWREDIQLFFTFDAEKKVEQYLHLAEVRLAEYEKMLEKGKEEIAARTLEKYENLLERALAKAEELKEKREEVLSELVVRAKEVETKNLVVLERNLDKVSESAKEGIEHALEAAQQKFVEYWGEGEDVDEVEDEIPADWQTYRNEQYGFEFRYPTNWVFSNPGNTGEDIHLSNSVMEERQKSGQVVIEIQAFHTKPVSNFETYVRDYVKNVPGNEPGPKGNITKLNLGNTTAFRVELSGGFGFAGPGYFIERDSTHYVYVLVYGDAEMQTVSQILSTFKFISPNSDKGTSGLGNLDNLL